MVSAVPTGTAALLGVTETLAALCHGNAPLLGVTEKSATYGELPLQGAEARHTPGLRPTRLWKDWSVRSFRGGEDVETTHRSSVSGYLVPTVSSPAAPAKARALKALADPKPVQRLRLDELARLLHGGKSTYSFLTFQSTKSTNQTTPPPTAVRGHPQLLQLSTKNNALRRCLRRRDARRCFSR